MRLVVVVWVEVPGLFLGQLAGSEVHIFLMESLHDSIFFFVHRLPSKVHFIPSQGPCKTLPNPHSTPTPPNKHTATLDPPG